VRFYYRAFLLPGDARSAFLLPCVSTARRRTQCVFTTVRFYCQETHAVNAIKLSLGFRGGSPLQPLNTWGLVGAYHRESP